MEINIANELKSLDIEIGKRLFSIAKLNELDQPPSPLQGKILKFLVENDGKEIYQKTLEERFKVSKATISEVIQTMENNKLIEMVKASKKEDILDQSENIEEKKEEDNFVEEESKESIEETIINNIAKANAENFDEDLQDTKTDLDESIHDTEILKEIKDREEEIDETKLSKRELRRLEKEKALQEAEELKKMRDDFLKTEEYEIIDEDVQEEPKKKGKGRKKRK